MLIEDLIIESIKIYGLEMYYLPRTLGSRDELYTEDDTSMYLSAYNIEMYIKSVFGFQGEGDMLRKFDLEIRDQMTLTVARRSFHEEVGTSAGLTRPREGDLVYFPLNHKIFKITFVEHEAVFYQLGALQTYDLKMELFEYSNEVFNTGIDYIDSLDDDYVFNLIGKGVALEAGGSLSIEATGLPLFLEGVNGLPSDDNIDADNDFIQNTANVFIDWSEHDPFSQDGVF